VVVAVSKIVHDPTANRRCGRARPCAGASAPCDQPVPSTVSASGAITPGLRASETRGARPKEIGAYLAAVTPGSRTTRARQGLLYSVTSSICSAETRHAARRTCCSVRSSSGPSLCIDDGKRVLQRGDRAQFEPSTVVSARRTGCCLLGDDSSDCPIRVVRGREVIERTTGSVRKWISRQRADAIAVHALQREPRRLGPREQEEVRPGR